MPESDWKQGGLSAYPVICLHLCVLVLRLTFRSPIRIRSRQENSTLYTGCVRQPDDVLSRNGLYLLELRHSRAEDMLMVIRLTVN